MRRAGIRKVAVLALAVFMAVSLTTIAGCTQAVSGITEADWSVTVKDMDGNSTEFTNEDAAKLGMVSVEAILEKSNGVTELQSWRGIKFARILKTAGIESYSRISVKAVDGYSQEYETEIIDDPNTILGLYLNGEEVSVDDGLPQLVVPALTGNFWIRNVVVIEVLE